MTRERRLAIAGCVFGLYGWAALGANAQQSLLRITSPATGDVVTEGQPFRITVSADDSVRMVYVLTEHPLPEARPIGNNLFEMVIPKTVPPGRYNLSPVGATSEPVFSEPVSIQVEREDPAAGLDVQPSFLVFAQLEDSYGMPVSVIGTFVDGSRLDVTHSHNTSFTTKDPEVARVDDQGKVIPVGPGQTSIIVTYTTGSSSAPVYAAMLVRCPLPKPTGPPPEIDSVTPETGVPGVADITIRGQHFGETQGNSLVSIGNRNGIVKRWTDTEIVATVDEHAHHGEVCVFRDRQYSNAISFTPAGLFIDAISGRPTPGNQIHIQGSGFESKQAGGYVTIADIKAQVVQWSSREIVVTVPDFSATGWTFQLAVHQDGKLAEFRLISPQKPAAK
jgi:IPT/TIG domain